MKVKVIQKKKRQEIPTPTSYVVSQTCIGLRKSSFPRRLGDGQVTEVNFQSARRPYGNEHVWYDFPYDLYENYVRHDHDQLFQIRDEGVYEMRLYGANFSFEQVYDDLKEHGEKLDDGNYFTVPTSLAAVFWLANDYSDAYDSGGTYSCSLDANDTSYLSIFQYDGELYCVKNSLQLVRAGVQAVVELSEQSSRQLGEHYHHEFDFDLQSVNPLFSYYYDPFSENFYVEGYDTPPPIDFTRGARFLFKWDTDQVLLYDEVLSLTPTAMAAILISAIATAMLSMDRLGDIYDQMNEEPS